MTIDKQEIIAFLVKAKQETYASGKGKIPSSRPNSNDLIYKEGNLKYIDSYLGSHKFIGEEALWQNDKPFWSMNYMGRVLSDKFNGDFLKLALYNVPKNKPFRGPEIFEDGILIYSNKVEGDFDWFSGYEKMHNANELVYECLYHGGKVE